MVGIGLFAPLPLAIMIPFMAGQSFAMGEAFGKGFQFGKRKISSMSNEDFNKLTGPEAFAETTADIKGMIPSMNSTMANFHTLQTDIIKQMIEYIAQLPAEVGPELIQQLITPVSNPNALFKWTDVYDFFKNIFGSDAETLRFLEKHGFASRAQKPQFTGVEFNQLKQFLSLQQDTRPDTLPPAPPLTQEQLLQKYANWQTYRQKGGLLTENEWRIARRDPSVRPPPLSIPQGKIYHPQYFRQLKSLQNNRNALQLQEKTKLKQIAINSENIRKALAVQNKTSLQTINVKRWRLESLALSKEISTLRKQIAVIQNAMNEFVAKFKPNQ